MTESSSPAAVLALRLDTLSDVIDSVSRATGDARARRQHLEDLEALLGPGSDLRSSLYDLAAGFRHAKRVLDELGPQVQDDHLNRLEQADIARAAEHTSETLEKLWQEIITPLDALGPSVGDVLGREADGHPELALSFKNACDMTRDNVQTLKRQLLDQRPGSADQPPLDQLWQAYESLLRQHGRPLFDAYVDFLGGVTLRETGLDGKVCDKADALLREQYAEFGPASLTVPVREAISEAAVRFVRIGFPEWTIWGLPLSAYEFGLIVANDRNNAGVLQALIGEHAGNDPGAETMFRRLAADALATLWMGPAYAAAAIFLRFSPLRHRTGLQDEPNDQEWAYLGRRLIARLGAGARGFVIASDGGVQVAAEHEAARHSDEQLAADRREWLDKVAEWALRGRRGEEEPADSERAYLIRCVLMEMGGDDRDAPFGAVVDRVMQAWTDALDHARNLPPRPGGHADHDFGLPAAERELLSSFAEQFVTRMPARYTRGVDATRFNQIAGWADALRGGGPVDAGPDPKLADLLNAAWQARLDPRCSADDVKAIAARVETLWANQVPYVPETDPMGVLPPVTPGEPNV